MIAFDFTEIAKAYMARTGCTAEDLLGSIPDMLSEDDPAGAVDQIDRAYKATGGGWTETHGHRLDVVMGNLTLTYPGDRPRELIADATLHDECVLFFNGAWIVVVQPDLSYRVALID